jgi:hypothetical protein
MKSAIVAITLFASIALAVLVVTGQEGNTTALDKRQCK